MDTLEASQVTIGPKSLPNYALAQSLYMSGAQLSQIAPQCNVTPEALRQYARRKGWKLIRTKAHSIVSQGSVTTPNKPEEIYLRLPEVLKPTQTHTIRNKLANTVGAQVDTLPKKLPKDPTEMLKVANATNALVSAAEKVEGWAPAPTSHLDIHVLGTTPNELVVTPETPIVPVVSG